VDIRCGLSGGLPLSTCKKGHEPLHRVQTTPPDKPIKQLVTNNLSVYETGIAPIFARRSLFGKR
jgi:hypothetical protein